MVSFSPHTKAVLQAFFVTFLWSTSWVLIKFGLRENIPPLTFAGLRYTLAFLCLLPLFFRQTRPAIERVEWIRLLGLGIVFYAATQGAQFVGLKHLPAVTVNLLLSLSAILVVGLGMMFIHEKPRAQQWIGLTVYLTGVGVFFYPVAISREDMQGIIVVLGGVAANAVSAVLGRSLNQHGRLTPITITTISMGMGSFILLAAGLFMNGLPHLTLQTWAIVAWLAVVNTAFAFTLWNNTLRILTALESSLINNLMMVQIPVMAWLFLGEALTLKAIEGLTLAFLGILLVQLRRI